MKALLVPLVAAVALAVPASASAATYSQSGYAYWIGFWSYNFTYNAEYHLYLEYSIGYCSYASRRKRMPIVPGRDLTSSETKAPLRRGFSLAAGQGFEPQLPDPESGVLPLDDPATGRRQCSRGRRGAMPRSGRRPR